MKTFAYLNGIVSDVTYTDNRTPDVKFDSFDIRNLSFTATSNVFPAQYPVNIVEIIRPDLANVKYTLEMPIGIDITVDWGTLPEDLTLTQVGNVYTITGITDVTDWNTIKEPTITVDPDFQGSFFYDTTIQYERADGRQFVEWQVGEYVPVTQCDAVISLSIFETRIKPLEAEITSQFGFTIVSNEAVMIVSTELECDADRYEVLLSEALAPISYTTDTNFILENTPLILRPDQDDMTLTITPSDTSSIDNVIDNLDKILVEEYPVPTIDEFGRTLYLATYAINSDYYCIVRGTATTQTDDPRGYIMEIYTRIDNSLYMTLNNSDPDFQIRNIALSENNHLIVGEYSGDYDANSTGQNGRVTIYNLDTQTLLRTHEDTNQNDNIFAYKVAINDDYYAFSVAIKQSGFATYEHVINLYDRLTGNLVFSEIFGIINGVSNVDAKLFLNDSQVLFSDVDSGDTKIWDFTGTLLHTLIKPVDAVNNDYYAWFSRGNTITPFSSIRIYSSSTFNEVTSISISPYDVDHNLKLANDNTICVGIWDDYGLETIKIYRILPNTLLQEISIDPYTLAYDGTMILASGQFGTGYRYESNLQFNTTTKVLTLTGSKTEINSALTSGDIGLIPAPSYNSNFTLSYQGFRLDEGQSSIYTQNVINQG